MAQITVIDDNPDIQFLLRIALEADGHEVSSIEDPAQVDHQLIQYPPDICVVDIMLPGVDGLVLLSRLRQVKALAKCLFVVGTGRTGKEVADAARQAGATDIIYKPYRPEEVRQRIGSLLEKSCGLPA